jgi:hypothetical protein
MEKKRMTLVALALILLLLLLTIFLVNNSLIKKNKTPAKDTGLPGSDDDGSEDTDGSGTKHPDGAVANPDGTYTYPDGLLYDQYGNLISGTVKPGTSAAEGNLNNSAGTLTPDQEVINSLEFHKYTGVQAAEKVASFISTMRKTDGSYYFSKECSSEKSGPEEIQNNNWAIMAYSALYDSTKKDVYKTRLLADWELSAADKSSGDLYTSFQLYQLYLLTDNYPTLLSQEDKEGLFRKVNSVGSSVITGYEPLEDYAMIIATLSRASFISSMILDETDDDSSPEVFQNAEDLLAKAEARAENTLLQKNSVSLKEGSCWIELAKLQKYELTGEESLLTESESYFESLDMDKEFENTVLLDNSIPMNLLPCAEALLILDEKTDNQEFVEDARAILQGYLKYSWDVFERRLCSGDGGILAKRVTSNNDGRKVMTDNAYFTYLLSQEKIKDYEFKWLK